jgi:O-methyltransferase
MRLIARALKQVAYQMGFEVFRVSRTGKPGVVPDHLPDVDYYRPLFSPWFGNGYGEFRHYLEVAGPHTLISPDRLYVLYSLARQAAHLGNHWYECGVFRGGSAMLLAKLLAGHSTHDGSQLHLFDTFSGMPETDPTRDWHKTGDLGMTSVEAVRQLIEPLARPGTIHLHVGLIPDTFAGLEDHRIAFCHCDLDIYRSILDCCAFSYPRLLPGGFLIFDDYGFPTCSGARAAVDEFFADKPETPLVLHTGQAIVCRAGKLNMKKESSRPLETSVKPGESVGLSRTLIQAMWNDLLPLREIWRDEGNTQGRRIFKLACCKRLRRPHGAIVAPSLT